MGLEQRPGDHECFDYHRDYVAKVPDGNILDTLAEQLQSAPAFMRGIDATEFQVTHEPYGWSVRTVLEHCCDAERVFGYRILRFSTGDQTDLPGWNENEYASCGYGDAADLETVAAEFQASRQSNLCLLNRLEEAAWDRLGLADGRHVSVRTLAWLMAGHWLHHRIILEKRLGLS